MGSFPSSGKDDSSWLADILPGRTVTSSLPFPPVHASFSETDRWVVAQELLPITNSNLRNGFPGVRKTHLSIPLFDTRTMELSNSTAIVIYAIR